MYYHPIQQKINNSEPIIFIHGTGMDHTVWTLPVRYFSRKKAPHLMICFRSLSTAMLNAKSGVVKWNAPLNDCLPFPITC